MLSYISDIYKRNLQGVLPCVFEKLFYTEQLSHIPRISPFRELFSIFAMIFYTERLFHIVYIHRVSLQCDSFHVFEENWDKGMLSHNSDIYKVNV